MKRVVYFVMLVWWLVGTSAQADHLKIAYSKACGGPLRVNASGSSLFSCVASIRQTQLLLEEGRDQANEACRKAGGEAQWLEASTYPSLSDCDSIFLSQVYAIQIHGQCLCPPMDPTQASANTVAAVDTDPIRIDSADDRSRGPLLPMLASPFPIKP